MNAIRSYVAGVRSTEANAIAMSTRYSSDAYAYSLPGGFVTPTLGEAASNVLSLPLRQSDVAARSGDIARTRLIADAACDLPAAWLAKNGVAILPIKIDIDGERFVDLRNDRETLAFFRNDIANTGFRARSAPLTASETRDHVQSLLHNGVDYVLALTIAASRSKIYVNSLAAAQNIMRSHGRARRATNNQTPFKMWVVDSETVFAGQGVLVAEAVRQLQAGMATEKLVAHLDRLRHEIHTLVVPNDLVYLYSRAKAKGDGSLNWMNYNLGHALDVKPVVHAHAGKTEPCMRVRGFDEAAKRVFEIAAHKLREGLCAPHVVVSYAGDFEEVRGWLPYIALETTCQRRNVALHLSPMSITGGINVGAGALSVAFAAKSLDLGD
jgi:DegV family protein with EDD domain